MWEGGAAALRPSEPRLKTAAVPDLADMCVLRQPLPGRHEGLRAGPGRHTHADTKPRQCIPTTVITKVRTATTTTSTAFSRRSLPGPKSGRCALIMLTQLTTLTEGVRVPTPTTGVEGQKHYMAINLRLGRGRRWLPKRQCR